jgi:four helix bundle protein
MALKIQKFEDLIAWQKARELAKAVYKMTEDGKLSRDFGLRDQLRRAAVSLCPIYQRVLKEWARQNSISF